MNDEQLRRLLAEDVGDEADQILPTVQHLANWEAPHPIPQQTASLVERLSMELPVEHHTRWRVGEWWPLLLIRSQIRVVQREIWITSVLVMALGTIVTLAVDHTAVIPLAILAPVVAAFGVALLYDSNIEQMLELEDTTGASVQILLLARLTLVFGFNLVLAISGSVLLAAIQPDISLWPLVLSWLAPMAFLSALAFLLSVLVVDATVSTVISLGLWGLHIFLRAMPNPTTIIAILSMPGLNTPANYGLLFATATLLTGVALWLVSSVEHSIGD